MTSVVHVPAVTSEIEVGLMDAILIDPLKKHTCNGIYQAL
jgi:hypothetical protein